MRSRLLRFGSVVAVALTLAALGGAALAQDDGVGRAAPDIGLPDMTGHAVRIAQLRGKVVIVNIWGTWCGPCVREIPFLEHLQQAYRDQGLVIIGVAQDGETGTMETFLRRHPVSYRIVHDREHSVAERYDHVSRTHAMPRSFIVDRQGRVQYIHVSSRASDLGQLEQQVQRLLAARR